MATKKNMPSWNDVKAKLVDFDHAGLLGMLQDLYAANKDNQAFLHARLSLGDDVLKPYKVTIDRWLWPDMFKNQDTSVAKVPSLFVLHGRIAKKQRAALIVELGALPPDAPRVLLATGKLVGEGFDHPPLDTLVLAMPSWKGTLQQYAGRLHREHATKTDVRIIDFVDTGHPALLRMWEKRQRGYRAMGYRMGPEDASDF